MNLQERLREYEQRKARALAMGGPAKLEARRRLGLLNARERIAHLTDPDSFLESGLFSGTEAAPADGKIAGYARIEGREVALVSNDFTVKGASSTAINGRKIGQMKRVATERGIPLVLLGESSGARMPDTMGAAGMGAMLGADPHQYRRTRETPWASAVLGPCFGSSTWYACISDFNVIRKGAVMAVSSPRLCSLAVGEEVDPEELGGWRLHTDVTGLADQVAESDEEALDAIRRFLSYLPSHHGEPPPELSPPAMPAAGEEQPGPDREGGTIASLLPESRTQVYDIRKVVAQLADPGSVFELKARFGKVGFTALARLGGRTVGIVANNPLFKGGALDADACDKITSFLVLCDSFNIPLVLLVDTPGFVIGTEAERQRAPGKIINFMNALSLCTVPKISVILRKTYGQAYLNMGGGRNSDEVAAWPTAEISFMDPQFAVMVVHGSRNEAYNDRESPQFKQALEEMARDSEVWDLAASHGLQHVIRPEETRPWLLRMLEVHRLRLSGGAGQHLMRAWPTSF